MGNSELDLLLERISNETEIQKNERKSHVRQKLKEARERIERQKITGEIGDPTTIFLDEVIGINLIFDCGPSFFAFFVDLGHNI